MFMQSLTSSRVLTMKFMDGVFVNDVEGLKQLGTCVAFRNDTRTVKIIRVSTDMLG